MKHFRDHRIKIITKSREEGEKMKTNWFVSLNTIIFVFLSGCAITHDKNDDRFNKIINKNRNALKKDLGQEEAELDKEEEERKAGEEKKQHVHRYTFREGMTEAEIDIASFIVSGTRGCIEGTTPPVCPYDQESIYLKGQWPPKHGLALSGGGTRAASFSIGVMKALNEFRMLDKMDLISSVSGGSYANFWYFSQKFYIDRMKENPPKFNKEIFKTWDDTGRVEMQRSGVRSNLAVSASFV